MPKTAKRQRMVGFALVAWNTMGVAMWALQASVSPQTLAQGDKVQIEVWEAMPLWAWAAYAVATWSGLLGAVALLRHRRIAVWLFAASTLGVFAQFSYALMLSPLVSAKGPGVIVFPAVIFMIALGSMAYAHSEAKRDRLS
jgi:hypothetical protein